MNGAEFFGVAAAIAGVVTVVGGVVALLLIVFMKKTEHARLARFYAARRRALDDAGLVFVDDGVRFCWRERADGEVDVAFHAGALACQLPAAALGERVAACWARHGGVGVLPRSAGVVLDDRAANAAVGAVVDDGACFRFDGKALVVEARAREGDIEPQVVHLIERTRTLSAALTLASSSLPPLTPASRAAALLET